MTITGSSANIVIHSGRDLKRTTNLSQNRSNILDTAGHFRVGTTGVSKLNKTQCPTDIFLNGLKNEKQTQDIYDERKTKLTDRSLP